MRLATALYWIIGSINLYAQLVEDLTINRFTKPLLIPVLIYWVFLKAAGYVPLSRLLLAGGLVLAWVGDVLLIHQGQELYFLGGLGAFLVMQVLYVIVFYNSMHQQKWPPFNLIIPFLLVFLSVGYSAFIYARPMWVSISFYMLSILSMLAFAMNRRNQTNSRSFSFVVIGAALFVLSDSLIGFNKFIGAIPLASFLIMATYIPAQYFIVQGIMKHEEA